MAFPSLGRFTVPAGAFSFWEALDEPGGDFEERECPSEDRCFDDESYRYGEGDALSYRERHAASLVERRTRVSSQF